MSVISTSLRTGINAANGGAARSRVQRQRADLNEAGRRDSAQAARRRAPERDTYEAGAAAYAGRSRQARGPDLQSYSAKVSDIRNRNDRAGEGRSARAQSRVARPSIDVRG